MITTSTEDQRQRLISIQANVEGFIHHVQASLDIWSVQLTKMQSSLDEMDEELLGPGKGELSITGERVISSSAQRASRLLNEASDTQKIAHHNLAKIGRSLSRNFDKAPVGMFTWRRNFENGDLRRNFCTSLIFDLAVSEGLNRTADALKKEATFYKYQLEDPRNLKTIVDDMREGDIGSALHMIRKVQPDDEEHMRSNLQSQMITDCIEIDNYDKAVAQIKRFRVGWLEELERAPLLIGALLVGRNAMQDIRYRDLFDYGNREQLSLKLAAFFMPNHAPLKLIMRYGCQALTQLNALGKTESTFEHEIPIEVSVNPSHSSFTCPILKEQCSSRNPPMRLACGHVISKEAINRLTISLRQVRSTARIARFKCPYCPREQFMENAKLVNFNKWVYDYEDDDLEIMEYVS